MKRTYQLLILLLLLNSAAFAQRITMHELIDITCLNVARFDSCMFRKGFQLKSRSESVANSAYIYHYQEFPYVSNLTQTSTLIQYICNARRGLLNFQQPSKALQTALRNELIAMGFKPSENTGSEVTERQIFYKDAIVISFKPADSGNGIAGIYTGYSISIHHERPM